MFVLHYILVLLLITGIVCPPSPLPIFDSFGANQLFVNEGSEVISMSGAHVLKDVTKGDCADSCIFMGLDCPEERRQSCCDSFSYNPKQKECYLKKRGQNSGLDLKDSKLGWQSFKYWGDETYVPGGRYDGGLPELAGAFSLPAGSFHYAYMSKGAGKLAKTEGDSILTNSGQQSLTGVTPKDCSNECDATSNCDAFSYNPNLSQGTCFLKSNSVVDKFITVDNSDGWTYFWKEETNYQRDCLCTCVSNYVCIFCGTGISPGPCKAI
eukprot:TRINITY_DN210_c0_g1_i10.p1 TRINITY_DN210_c0_g1~~TRINITY_DN210_c0_g1_i10.p1  ORF type:complete len:310 (+),score=32.23 TRINITY_DN210_c0_g1_i10:131-931(+)